MGSLKGGRKSSKGAKKVLKKKIVLEAPFPIAGKVTGKNRERGPPQNLGGGRFERRGETQAKGHVIARSRMSKTKRNFWGGGTETFTEGGRATAIGVSKRKK